MAGIVGIARELDIRVLTEGVKNRDELHVLRAAGISLIQRYYSAKPAFMALPDILALHRTADVRTAM